AAEPSFLIDAVAQRRGAGRRARRAPGPALLVGIAHEAERREPFEPFVVRGLKPANSFLAAIGQIDAGTPNHVLAELFVLTAFEISGLIGTNNVIENLFAVERDHGFEAVLRHEVDGLAAGNRHPNLDRQMLWSRYQRDVLKLVAAIIDRGRTLVVLALEVKRLLVEASQQQPQLLLEQFAIFFGIEQRSAEGLDLARMIAAADTHDDAA